jgi:hypothetical protein
MSDEWPDEVPEHYRVLLKNWLRIAIPAHVNAHALAMRCNIPIGSYFITGGAMFVETQSYLDAVKPLLAAEEIGSHPQPAEQAAPIENELAQGDNGD